MIGLTETSVICYGKACGFRHTSLATEEKHPDGTKRIQQTYAQSEPTNRVPSDQQSRDAGNIINGYGNNMTEMDAAKTLTEKHDRDGRGKDTDRETDRETRWNKTQTLLGSEPTQTLRNKTQTLHIEHRM